MGSEYDDLIKKLNLNQPVVPKIDISNRMAAINQAVESMEKFNNDKFQREKENHQNLKRIANATEDINSKLDFVSKDLEYILNSIGGNFQRLERLEREEKEALDKIILALMYKNNDSKSGIKELFTNKAPDFIVSVIFGLIELKMKNP